MPPSRRVTAAPAAPAAPIAGSFSRTRPISGGGARSEAALIDGGEILLGHGKGVQGVARILERLAGQPRNVFAAEPQFGERLHQADAAVECVDRLREILGLRRSMPGKEPGHPAVSPAQILADL